jgi:trehalose 6-phosphate phosphatase
MTQPLLLWQHLGAMLQRCVASQWCVVLLAYDGTLAPLVADPATACLSPAMRQVLTLLVQHPHFQVAIMSGRTLADLQRHVGDQVPYLAGNHGLEMTGPQAIYCHPDARRLRPELAPVVQSLHHHLRDCAGVWVEDKGLTLTVHMRGVPPACRRAVQWQIVHLLQPALETRRFALRKGTAVVEVRPRVRWDKGEAVRWLVEHMCGERPATRPLVIYIGDDETDEDAFRAVRREGLGIVVGEGRLFSAAPYAIASVEQTAQFLAVFSGLTWPQVSGVAHAMLA